MRRNTVFVVIGLILLLAVATSAAEVSQVVNFGKDQVKVTFAENDRKVDSEMVTAKTYEIEAISEVDLTIPKAINNRGDTVGSMTNALGQRGGFFWSNGQIKLIEGTSKCTAINDQGVFGGIFFPPNSNYQRAFLVDGKGEFVDLTTALGLTNGDRATNVYDINSRGQIAGGGFIGRKWVGFTTNQRHRGIRVMPMTGCSGINNAGQIVGNNLANKPVVVSADGVMTTLPLPNIYCDFIYPIDINESGKVIGSSWDNYFNPYTCRPLLWEKKRGTWMVQTLPILEGYTYGEALGINSRGQIAGTCYWLDWHTPYWATIHLTPVLWEKGNVVDLASLCEDNENLVPWGAVGVNDRGEILGYALNRNQRQSCAVIFRKK